MPPSSTIEHRRDRPSDREVEVSLIGPGYGECVVVHLGANRWMVVDSCLDRDTGRAAALVHLEEMGIDPGSHVDLVVCTHWHDDHVRGISAILAACPGARFICSTALRESAFLELVALGESIRGLQGSGLSEFARIFQQIKLRRARHEPAPLEACHAGCGLLDQEENGRTVRVESLSPSEVDHQRMAGVFAEKKSELLAAEFRQTVPSLHPNLGSIVLRIQVGTRRILLGADMEHRKSPDAGWNAILDSSEPGHEADFYKIAHHGSATGDTPEIWSKLLTPDCPAALAPNQRLAKPLPKPTDVERILSQTAIAFATAPSNLKKKRIEQPAERLLRAKGIEVYEVPSSQGTVMARSSMDGLRPWEIKTFGRAFRLAEAG